MYMIVYSYMINNIIVSLVDMIVILSHYYTIVLFIPW